LPIHLPNFYAGQAAQAVEKLDPPNGSYLRYARGCMNLRGVISLGSFGGWPVKQMKLSDFRCKLPTPDRSLVLVLIVLD